MSTVLLGLGSSLGPRLRNLRLANAMLVSSPEISAVARSRVYCSAPMGPAGRAFLNAALRIETTLDEWALLDWCQEVERRLGRQRAGHWMDRVIDVDILLFDEKVHRSKRLTIPHPGLLERPFAWVPCQEIAGELIHPKTRRSLKCSATDGPKNVFLWSCL